MTFSNPLLATAAAVAALAVSPAVAQGQQYQNGHYVWQNGHYVWQQAPQSQYGYQTNAYAYPNGQNGYQNGQYAQQNSYSNGRYVYQNGRYVWQQNQAASSNPQYGYQQRYGNEYGYGGASTQGASAAAQQCSAAVQNKLQTRQGLASTIASLVGVGNNARVVSINPAVRIRGGRGAMRVTGLASSGNFGSYGVGAYGAAAYAGRADLSFTCDVNRYGSVTAVDVKKL
jgi:hypothetical protein